MQLIPPAHPSSSCPENLLRAASPDAEAQGGHGNIQTFRLEKKVTSAVSSLHLMRAACSLHLNLVQEAKQKMHDALSRGACLFSCTVANTDAKFRK